MTAHLGWPASACLAVDNLGFIPDGSWIAGFINDPAEGHKTLQANVRK